MLYWVSQKCCKRVLIGLKLRRDYFSGRLDWDLVFLRSYRIRNTADNWEGEGAELGVINRRNRYAINIRENILCINYIILIVYVNDNLCGIQK